MQGRKCLSINNDVTDDITCTYLKLKTLVKNHCGPLAIVDQSPLLYIFVHILFSLYIFYMSSLGLSSDACAREYIGCLVWSSTHKFVAARGRT